VGRRNDDDAWPRPVWGFTKTDTWTVYEAQALCSKLATMRIE
jgi:hypothetical protein